MYFGGLGQLFFNKAVETTVLERITGTVSMFLFPIVIYFCIFSFMARSTPCTFVGCMYSPPRHSTCPGISFQ